MRKDELKKIRDGLENSIEKLRKELGLIEALEREEREMDFLVREESKEIEVPDGMEFMEAIKLCSE